MLLQSLFALSFVSIPFCSGVLRNPNSVAEFRDTAEGSGVAAITGNVLNSSSSNHGNKCYNLADCILHVDLLEVPESLKKRPRAELEDESSEDIQLMSMSDEDTEDEGKCRRDPSRRGQSIMHFTSFFSLSNLLELTKRYSPV
jgi:hypothetical protein